MPRMKFPESQRLGLVQGPDGLSYSLHFFGENEGAAVIVGPIVHALEEVPEIHREPASDAKDARAKLEAWRRANGWPMQFD